MDDADGTDHDLTKFRQRMDDLCLPVTQFLLAPPDLVNGILELFDLPMKNRIEFREPGPELSKLSRRQTGYGFRNFSYFDHNPSSSERLSKVYHNYRPADKSIFVFWGDAF